MNSALRTFTVVALAALLPSQAMAQAKPCLTEREVAQIAIYSVPAAVEGVRAKCANRLSSNGFLATRGNAFAARYAALQAETWPTAKAGVLRVIGSQATGAQSTGPAAMFAALPDESVRPLVDAIIAQKIGESIKPAECANVERGMQIASALAPRDSGAMIAFVLAMIKPRNLAMCPAQS
ncbi:hypothetical protein [Tsuneonella aeria]|uniref:hypothetical protein n=1 Tax=Tsuneonella aeria TaxID=1837929 RepID=UPI001F42C700|nr:hypothetical protein [Tsuneonella aeria]